jgi:hypothetical protein
VGENHTIGRIDPNPLIIWTTMIKGSTHLVA